LHLIFAKDGDAGSDCFTYSFRWVRFADSDELYVIRVSTGTRGRLLNPPTNVRQIYFYIALHTANISNPVRLS
jgi:hypothetical protein